MIRRATLIGFAALAASCSQESGLRLDSDDWPVPSPPIANCAADFRERGRPTEQPVETDAVADLKTALDYDLRGIEPDGLAGFHALEPVCFYLVSDGRVLMRDGRGIEYYFRKIPRWIPDRVDFPAHVRQAPQ